MTQVSTSLFPSNRRRAFTLIELLVVMAIAAMVISFASVAYFNASRQEGYNRAKKQLSDVCLLAKQSACMSGKPHALVFWNQSEDVAIGNATNTRELPRYAVYTYVGMVIVRNKYVCVPYSADKYLLNHLRRTLELSDTGAGDGEWKGVLSNAIDLSDPTNGFIGKVRRIHSEDEGGLNMSQGVYRMGPNQDIETGLFNIPIGEVEDVVKNGSSNVRFPLALQMSEDYIFPQSISYQSDSKDFREVVVFSPEGTITSGDLVLTLNSARNTDSITATFKADGTVDITGKTEAGGE